jgi:hypothetical protein
VQLDQIRIYITSLIIVGFLFLIAGGCGTSAESSSVEDVPPKKEDTTQIPIEDKIEKALAQLIEGMNTHDFQRVAPLLNDAFFLGSITGDTAKTYLEQVVTVYPATIERFTIQEIKEMEGLYHVQAELMIQGNPRSYSYVLADDGTFININMFRLQTQVDTVSDDHMEIPQKIEAPCTVVQNLLITEIEVNGHRCPFLIDSGAPKLIINKAHLDHIPHIREDSNQTGVAGGVSGGVGISMVHLASFDWRGLIINEFEAIAMDLAHLEEKMNTPIYGLISQQELIHFQFTVDYEIPQITLYKLDNQGKLLEPLTLAQSAVRIPFTMQAHIPIMVFTIGNVKVSMGLDTGAQTNLLSLDLRDAIDSHFTVVSQDELIGADGNIITVDVGTIDQMVVSGLVYPGMKTTFSDISHLTQGYGIELDGLVGYEFLSQNTTYVNYKTQELVVIPE